MKNLLQNKNPLGLFIILLVAFTSISFIGWVSFNKYYWFINTYMWCPSLAALSTLLIQKKDIRKAIKWDWGKHKYQLQSLIVPFAYTFLTYLFGYALGFGSFGNPDYLNNRLERMGLEPNYSWLIILLFGTIWGIFGVLYNMASSLGEEIGWRGFLLSKLLSKKNFILSTCIVGTLWAFWHFPLIYVNTMSFENIPWLAYFSFWIGLLGISFIFTYYFIKSKSIWTSVILHSSHNYFVGAYFGNLTIDNDLTDTYLGESGVLFAVISALFGLTFLILTRKMIAQVRIKES